MDTLEDLAALAEPAVVVDPSRLRDENWISRGRHARLRESVIVVRDVDVASNQYVSTNLYSQDGPHVKVQMH
jgi:hypothetical protein